MADKRRPRWLKVVGWLLAVVVALIAILVVAFAWRLEASKPRLDGRLVEEGLQGQVTIERDATGVPTITAENRGDMAFALGYLHGQERFFQMDQLRRTGAGELSAVFGQSTEATDRAIRVHRFRARAHAAVAALPAFDRAVLAAYTRGVNRGLDTLSAKPFEYLLLRSSPTPWLPEDSLLVWYAMYIAVQGVAPEDELNRVRAEVRVGHAFAAVLYPEATALDAPIDGSSLAEPALPTTLKRGGSDRRASIQVETNSEILLLGSNNWAVSGALTTTGAALVANDMHVPIAMPNVWYRARLVQSGDGFDSTGVTLPGSPTVVAGSNRHIAWGFTTAYLDSHDAVIIEAAPGQPDAYLTPSGVRPLVRTRERLCVAARCGDMTVEETIWGPVVAKLPDGRKIVERWTAHDPAAVGFTAFLRLERASGVADAIAIARTAVGPQSNFIVGDSAGHIGWTIFGRVPARFGHDGRWPTSWADGRNGWRGYLPEASVPTVIDPPGGRLWTANARVVGGAAYALLGDGGYDNGARAARIRDRLMAHDRFTPRDMLSIQLDDHSDRNRFWQAEMLRALLRQSSDPTITRMIAEVRRWNGRAAAESIGYRLIARYRRAMITEVYAAYVGAPSNVGKGNASYVPAQSEGVMRRLLTERSAALVPPGFAGWEGVDAKVLANVTADVREAGGLANYRWGAQNVAGVHHPLARAIPLLAWLTDPADAPQNGDSGVPRVAVPGFGQSERFAVAPGHEADAVFQMPGGQAGNPLSPYYLKGHDDWLEGRPGPFLPGQSRWVLVMKPADRGR